MSTPRDRTRSRRARVVRLISVAIVVGASGGLLALTPSASQPADAADLTSSALTVKWANDSSSAAAYQPARSASSPHYAQMKNISVNVSQTTGIVDQAIQVSVAGFAGTVASQFGQNSMNYMQAMQCWGPDPLADDFRETCQWGGRYVINNGLGNSVYFDNTLRVASADVDPSNPTKHDVPFRTAQGREISGKPVSVDPDGTGPLPPEVKYGILDLFNPATTNEVSSARVGNDGTGFFDFETQSAAQSPQLDCGNGRHTRCWLVIVPRGTVFGGNGAECSGLLDPGNTDAKGNDVPYAKGRPNSFQGGSPVNNNCDYWDNRITVPLDFSPVGTSCKIGSAEQRVIGSQLMVGAMSSWQPDLCDSVKTSYSFSTNPDSIARRQILEGQANAAFVGFPVSPGELETNAERQALANSTIVHAPVANSSVVVAYLAEFDAGRQVQLNLSPRLVAKLLTQSYEFTVPWNSSDPSKNFAHLPAKNRDYIYLWQDPDFQALNPSNYQAFRENPAMVLPGPAGADAIRQVWRWIDADADAVAFLNGSADPWGMSINPYYLPAGAANAAVPTFNRDGEFALKDGQPALKPVGLKNIDDSPLSLSTTVLDTFPKSDQSEAPIVLGLERTRFGSLQYSPYTDNLLSGARVAFRATPNSKTTWDPTKLNSAGESGDWVSAGGQAPGQKFMIAITDSPSASRYGLTTANLSPANKPAFVKADAAGMASALRALSPTSVESVTQVDPAGVGENGYPLTMVTYAEVNLNATTAAIRTNIANLIDRVTTSGQTSGSAPGQLPAGYLPLTTDQRAQAARTSSTIKSFVPGSDPELTTSDISGAPNGGSVSAFDDSGAIVDGTATPTTATTTVETGAKATVDRTSSASAAITRGGLAVSLGVGLLGALAGPQLLRRRGFL